MAYDKFTQTYLGCALWSSNDGSDESGGQPLDLNYDFEDLAPITAARAWRQCRDFQWAARDLIKGLEEQAGHDFWLTRNGHGAGFWDRPEVYGKEAAECLTRMAEACGSLDAVIGDDHLIYFE